MDVTPSRILQLQTSFYGFFKQGYEIADTWWEQLAMRVPSSSKQNDYGWMADLPKMREWLGPRTIQGLQAYSYSLTNRKFELTVGVDREHIEDDSLGIYEYKFKDMGDSAKKHPDELIADLLINGHSYASYDGQGFFDTAHPVNLRDASVTNLSGANTQSNYFTGTPLTQANFQAMRAKMLGYCDEGGRPLKVVPNVLWCGPALEPVARKILEADTILEALQQGGNNVAAAGVTNITKGQAKVLMIPELSGGALDLVWGLACTSKPIKPFIFQDRKADVFVPKTALTDENVFRENRFDFGIDNRRNAGFSLWFLALRASG